MGAYDGHRTASGNVGRHSRPQPARRNAMQQNVAENPQEKTAPRLQPPVGLTSTRRLMPARPISFQRLYSQYVGLCLYKTHPGGQQVRMSLPQGRRVTRVEPAGRKGHPVCRRYRRHRVHHSQSRGLRSGGARFRVSVPPITSPRRGLRAESGRRNCPIPSPGRSRRLRSTCRCCPWRCHGNPGRNSPARPAHRSSG